VTPPRARPRGGRGHQGEGLEERGPHRLLRARPHRLVAAARTRRRRPHRPRHLPTSPAPSRSSATSPG